MGVGENLERCVLSSFLFVGTCHDNEIKDAFKLDPVLFSTPFRRRLAERINEETEGERAYQVLCADVECAVAGTRHEQEMIDILSASPMPLSSAKRLHDELARLRRLQVAKGAA